MTSENKEMIFMVTITKKENGGFNVKTEGQGDTERKAREDLFNLPSLEISPEESVKILHERVASDVILSFNRCFIPKDDYDPDDYEPVQKRQ